MAAITQGGVVLLNGIDLSCYLKNIKVNQQVDMLDNTTLCATAAQTFQPGLVDRSIDANGFYKTDTIVTATDIDGLFKAALESATGDYLMSIGTTGATASYPAIFANIKEVGYDIDSSTGQLIMAALKAKATKTSTADVFRSGAWLFYATATTATNGTTYDNAAASTGYIGQIHVLAGGNASVTIQHSTDGSTWVDLVAAATFTLNTATQFSLPSGTTRRYIRAVVDQISGTTTVGVTIKGGYSG